MKIEGLTPLETRELLAPVVSIFPRSATFTPFTTNPPTITAGTVTVAEDPTALNQATFPSAAPMTSVSLFTPISSFGGDIVRIRSGPGGDFGKGLYAISRGAGSNAGAIDRPGVIYRVDPATGKSSVFFDLNTVVSQLEPGATAANGTGASTGLVNWYDIAFDKEGVFDGRPSMFIASVDRQDPVKNAIYRVAPDGTFMGAFASFTDGQAALRFTSNPTAILVPPAQQQSLLRGLFSGSGLGASTLSPTTFSAFFFDANRYRPGQNISSSTLPFGMSQTAFTFGPQVGFTAANTDYLSPIYDVFTDFGTPAGGGIPARPGLSGVQGYSGELLINGGVFPLATDVAADVVDRTPAISTPFRRFQDIAFDQYGYFSQGYTLTAAANTGTTTTGGIVVGNTLITLGNLVNAGSLFVADLGTGLSVPITPPGANVPTLVPVQGPGGGSVTTGGVVTSPGGNLGGRIVRIDQNGRVTNFATNFNTSGDYGSQSFVDSSLSITFSEDGTTLYASDNDGVWQFKTTASLASSTTGSLIGLNDLRTLGIPYEGQNTAVAVLDTGVDATTPNFRGRVSAGKNIITNGLGNTDTSAGGTTNTNNNGGNNGGGGGTNGNGGGGGGGTSTTLSNDGHGTLIAGVIAQFVPETTIVPINLFAPFITGATGNNGNNNGGGGNNGGGNNGGTTLTATSNALSTPQNVYNAFGYVASHPFVKDPVRPMRNNRVIAAAMGFGTTETFDSEGSAFQGYSQIVISLKNQLHKFRKLGIAPIAAAGQLGAPLGAGSTNNNGGGGNNGGGNNNNGGGGSVNGGNNNAENSSVGDVNGISLPAILNEVISVTGTIPFPYATSPSMTPNDPVPGVYPELPGPVLIFGNNIFGGTGTNGNGGGTVTNGTTGPALGLLTNGNNPYTGGGTNGNNNNGGGNNNTTGISLSATFYVDRFLAASNRNVTTDFAAPAIDVPTFRRRFAGDGNIHLVFQQAGTSLSAGVVTGTYALVSSALDYWSTLYRDGATSDAYLTQPVGANTLNYGKRAIKNLTPYNNPDGINSILAWTSVPALDPNDGLTQSTPPDLTAADGFRSYARVDVGNAIAAIEGTVALQWLLKHDTFAVIDSNSNGLITAQEIQDFVDKASTIGMAEAGAMARQLGGTALAGTDVQSTLASEFPDQPAVLQRRFNFFDYVADGQLNGAVSIDQLKILAHTLLPTPTSGVIVDRQRASANGFLVDPNATRNFKELQHILPTYQFVPKSAVQKYRGISPNGFRVNRGQTPSLSTFPVFTLFNKGAGLVRSTATTTTTTSTSTSTSSSTSTPTSTAPTGTTPAPTTTTTTTTPTTTTGTTSSTTTNSTQAIVDQLLKIANQNTPTVGLGTPTPTGNLSSTTNNIVSLKAKAPAAKKVVYQQTPQSFAKTFKTKG